MCIELHFYIYSLPLKDPQLKMQLWDADVLNPNDAVCESVINLTGFLFVVGYEYLVLKFIFYRIDS
jgi:hypothetical protein